MKTDELVFDIGGHTFNWFKAHIIVDLERVRWNSADGEYVMIVLFPKGGNKGTYPLRIFLGTDEEKAKKDRVNFYEWWKKSLIYYSENKEAK